MINFILFMQMSLVPVCPKTEIVAKNWNQTDGNTLIRAQSRCVELYPASPCLVKFIKRGPENYWAICGKPR